MRIENDQLGQLELDDTTLYGIHSLRSKHNFINTEHLVHHDLIKGMILVKQACATSNNRAGLLEDEQANMIVMACSTILSDYNTYKDSFITHPLQGGAGTSTNMNVNEVIANAALTLSGHKAGDYTLLHPLNHVNMSQSTNDVYPTALKIAAIFKVRSLAEELAKLQEAFQQKENQYANVLKLGRTQLMDALPITMGQTFGSYARAISRDRWRIYKVEERLREVNIGGTAVGTGMNAPLIYIYSVTEELQKLTGLGIARSDLLIDSTQNMDVFTEVSGLLKALATNLIKISGDLRLLNSGPVGGFGEISLKAHQAGSSIMPGKVNPVICEMISQIGFKVIGADTAITYAASSGALELNPFGPLIADELLNALDLLIDGVGIFNHKVVQTIEVNESKCTENALNSYSLAAAFIDALGYDTASTVAKASLEKGMTIKDYLLSKELLDEASIDKILNTHQLTQPGIPGKR